MNAHEVEARAKAGRPVPDAPGFAYVGHWSARIYCVTCYRTGFPGGSWMDPCVAHPEHPHLCLCSRRFPSKAAIAAHVRACERWGHPGHERLA